MRNTLPLLMLTSAFFISFNTLGIAEPSKTLPPPNPGAALNATAGEAHLHGDYLNQTPDEETQTTTQVEQAQNPTAQTQAVAEEDDHPWKTAESNRIQKTQIPAGGTGIGISQAANQTGQMQDQIDQAQGTKDQAAAQVEGSTQQAMQQGVSQTQQVGEQLRQNMNSVAQDMQSTVSSTKAG